MEAGLWVGMCVGRKRLRLSLIYANRNSDSRCNLSQIYCMILGKPPPFSFLSLGLATVY